MIEFIRRLLIEKALEREKNIRAAIREGKEDLIGIIKEMIEKKNTFPKSTSCLIYVEINNILLTY